jgi:hypothetical protein
MPVSDEQKRKIDEWIKANGRNQYGDKPDTVYAGGNPLFDEMSPKLKDRYEYIIERNPQLKIDSTNGNGK